MAFISLVTDSRVEHGYCHCGLVEYASNKISRVVRSTMAAERAALSTAVDRQLYLRALLQTLLYGEVNYGPGWREKLCVPGVLVTDARSVYDHLTTTGSIPTERQVLLDLLSVRELLTDDDGNVQQGTHGVSVKWVPSKHQLSDGLTKRMTSETLEKFMANAEYSLVETPDEAAVEKHLAALRRGQRLRAKERKQAVKRQL